MYSITKQFLVGLVVFGMLVLPVQTSIAQDAVTARPSHAVMITTQLAIAGLYNRMASNSATSADYASAAMALKMMFADWDESGLTDKLQNYFLSHESEFLEGPQSGQSHASYLAMRATGLAIKESDVSDMFSSVSSGSRANALQLIKTNGLRAMNAQLVAALQNRAVAMASTGNRLKNAAYITNTECVTIEALGAYMFIAGFPLDAFGVGEALQTLGGILGVVHLFVC